MANSNSEIEKRLWSSADELRANSKLKSSEYSVPVLGLIFLRYADYRFTQAEKELAAQFAKKSSGTGRREIGKEDYQAKGVMFLPPTARFSHLLERPEGENIGKAINEAMKAVEAANEELKGVLPKSYTKIENATLVALLKTFSQLAVDARQSEMEIRKKLLLAHAVDVMIAIGPNFFYTVMLPCTLWFFDRGKAKTDRKDKVLFIDARHIFRQIDRAHRAFSPKQIEFIANIVRLYRGEKPEFIAGDDEDFPANERTPEPDLKTTFPKLKYADVAGLCKVATLKEIEAQGYSLNPGRYVGVADKAADDFVFAERLEELNEELEVLNSEARELEERIVGNVAKLLEASS